MSNENHAPVSSNFIKNIINEDLKNNKNDGRVHTRFPPEPNGYLHIGHAKSICLNFGLARDYKGLCNLRFDDTNPSKEDVEYVESIQEDVRWLGFDWEERLFYASDYFEKMYEYAVDLIKAGKAYVCDLSGDQIRETRGTLKQPGVESPYRDRSVEENLDLFHRMRAGEFPDGSRVLRAKIDMASPNMNMRDPVLYRIAKVKHHRTGNEWCIYPMYDYAHPLSDAYEGITHSICTLEFEDHRPLYDWVLKALNFDPHPQQIEFARLNLSNTVMSKRKLRELVENEVVDGWDDPRMPTICGLRRRGYTPEAIKDFCDRIGVAKSNSVVDIALLEHCVREDLKLKAPRMMGVINPLRVVITNYPEGQEEKLKAENNPENPEMGHREMTFEKEIYIERDDFMEDPPKKFFRLAPGKEVRLKYAYIIRCDEVIKDPDTGEVIELRCSYEPTSKSGSDTSGKKVKGTLHWVSKNHSIPATVRLYDHLFIEKEKEDTGEIHTELNPGSVKKMENALVEPGFKEYNTGQQFQFMRHGYFALDTEDNKTSKTLVFNRIVSLRDTWAKIQKSQK
ncbi:glutaminyl-tRNA synthetase [Tindallia magadiensis]|uniref:Glutamine--tRNA ligase n=1 Tax=Tindallia magadiensis TaxID=69895 RepID=A0A1I3DLV9_9FIRM|nr:glutamine--tRNA ligase/YqeY domain fusion protein [Tindallia magadiensis]SFH87724.1 glutaminyl-tRNA synthetase [Tindallia magadiensis]